MTRKVLAEDAEFYQCEGCGGKWPVKEHGDEQAKALAQKCEEAHCEVTAALIERAIRDWSPSEW